jgi:hypothetical protein
MGVEDMTSRHVKANIFLSQESPETILHPIMVGYDEQSSAIINYAASLASGLKACGLKFAPVALQ